MSEQNRAAPTPPADIRILIADDHPVVRHGLAALLDRQIGLSIVAEAANGEEAVALFRQYQPDVALLDLRMPLLDGVETIRQIRTDFPDARIIILTTYDTDENIYQALKAGAMGYLLKDAEPTLLLETVRNVAAGRKSIPAEIALKLSERINYTDLTARELEVLQALAKGLNNREIGTELGVGEGTVRAHLNNIFIKLGVTDRVQATTVALKRGLVRLE